MRHLDRSARGGRLWLLILTALLFAAHSAAAGPRRPKLVVLIVIDQFRHEFLQRFDPWFVDGGFRRLQSKGADFTNAHYGHLATFTGPGHATIATGSHPNKHGIVANRFFNRAGRTTTSSLYDPEATLVGGPALTPADDTSPRALVGTTLGDQLRITTGMRAKVIGLSLKDRGAILLGGRLGRAYWFNEGTGRLTTSAYYPGPLPSWVKAINDAKIPEGDFGKSWEAKLPAEAHRFGPDDAPGENGGKGMGKTFPHKLTGGLPTPGGDFYEAWGQTPLSVDYTFRAAERCIKEESLGADDVPDLLGLSLSTVDYCGHGFGPDSWEMQELIVETDRLLAGFLDRLSRRFAPGELTVVLTADHGSGPLPERMSQLGFAAGRIKKASVKQVVEAALNAKYGAGEWILSQEEPSLYLNQTLITERKLDADEVARTAGEAALTVPGMAWYFTRRQLLSGPLPQTPLALQAQRSFSPERSGDLFLVPKPFYYWSSYGEREAGATHGSPYEYDTHVPLLIWGAGIRPGHVTRPVGVVDLAPTLAQLLGVDAPTTRDGQVLPEALR